MSLSLMGPASGLTSSKLADANADVSDVLKGKKFFAGDKNVKTGTLELTGSAGAGDVLSGATFYNTDAKSKQTGSLALSGNVNAAQVLSGYTFYKTDPKTKVTGTMANRGAVSETIAPGGSYTIQAGYHNGSGKVTAKSAGSVLKTHAVTMGGPGSTCRPWTYTMGSWGTLVGVASIGYPAANTGGDIGYISISGNTISIMTSGNGNYNRTVTLLYY